MLTFFAVLFEWSFDFSERGLAGCEVLGTSSIKIGRNLQKHLETPFLGEKKIRPLSLFL